MVGRHRLGSTMAGQPGSGASRRTSLGGSMVWFAASLGVGTVGYLAVNAVAARLLGASDFGHFVVLVTIAIVLGQLGLLGVHRSGLREAARLADDDHEGLAELRAGARAITQLALPLAGVAGALITWFYTADRTSDHRMVLAVEVGLLAVLCGHQILWSTFLRGTGQVRIASLLEGRSGGAVVSVLQAGVLLVVLILMPWLGLAGALGAVVLGYLAPVVWARRRLAARWLAFPRRFKLLKDFRHAVARDWRYCSSQTSGALNVNVDIWVAGFVLAATDNSLFGSAQRLAALLVIPLTSVQIVFLPSISRLAAAGDRDLLTRVLRTGALLAFGVSLAVALPMLIAPGPVLSTVFGSEFAGAAALLVVLVLGALATALAGLPGPALSMSHNEGAVATANWIALAVRVPLGVLAAMFFGVWGLAVVGAAVTAMRSAGLWLRTRQLVGVNTLPTLRPSLAVLRRISG